MNYIYEYYIQIYSKTADWLNLNQGVLSIIIFIITVTYAWSSGIIDSLKRKPKISVKLIDGPTFCCTYPVGKISHDHEVHRTGIALYMKLTNTGSIDSSIEDISVGYHWHLRPFSLLWLRYTIGWFWLYDQAVALADFQVLIGNKTKVYPFLIQTNSLSPAKAETFLRVGQSTNGVVYFEQNDSWGGCFPTIKNGSVLIKICIHDTFGGKHISKRKIKPVSFSEARRFNPKFGVTFSELRGENLSVEEEIRGNDVEKDD